MIQRSLILFYISFLRFFFYKTRANTEQVLPVQTGLYLYDDWRVQKINDENLMLTKLNVS